MMERFTDRARKVMSLARKAASELKHEYVGTEHVLLGLAEERSGVATNVLRNLEMGWDRLREEVLKLVQRGPEDALKGHLPLTPRVKQLIEFATDEAHNLGHAYVGTEHLLLGCLRVPESVACQVLLACGMTPEAVREEVLTLLGHSPEANQWSDLPTLEALRQVRAERAIRDAGPELLALWEQFFAAHDEFLSLFTAGQMKTDAADEAQYRREDAMRRARMLVKHLKEGDAGTSATKT